MLKPKDLLESLEKVAYSDDMLEPRELHVYGRQQSLLEGLSALGQNLPQNQLYESARALVDRSNRTYFSYGGITNSLFGI